MSSFGLEAGGSSLDSKAVSRTSRKGNPVSVHARVDLSQPAVRNKLEGLRINLPIRVQRVSSHADGGVLWDRPLLVLQSNVRRAAGQTTHDAVAETISGVR